MTRGYRHVRGFAILLAVGLAMTMSTTSVSATHTLGTLDCGSAGTFQVEGIEPAGPAFDVPPPWSGIYLLEGTTRVFRAFSNSHFGTEMTPATKFPTPLITCTLSSVGPMFDPEWTLVGVLRP